METKKVPEMFVYLYYLTRLSDREDLIERHWAVEMRAEGQKGENF